MLIAKIILGLLGLGIVVFIHELGHFLAARLVGIDVEAFSVGWGNPILKKKVGEVEYRIGMFPIGGYCKMKGENEFQEAYGKIEQEISPVTGTYYGVGPIRRIIVSFAGPLFNLLFAVLVLAVIWGVGFEIHTLDNRIVLASDVNPGDRYPADESGLMTGDRIVRIGNKVVINFRDIQEAITPYPEKDLAVMVERDAAILECTVRPDLDKTTGAGKIGVYYWADPVVGAIVPESPAAIAGIEVGDRIRTVNGKAIPYTAAMLGLFRDQPPVLTVEYERQGGIKTTDIVLSYTDGQMADIGMAYQTIQYRTPSYSPVGALVQGAQESWKIFVISLKSLVLLFKGIDLTQAVSGPIRITYMVGDVAAEGFGQSIGAGLSATANFLALISIALCIMNLLPLPVLDGGMILLFIVEIIKGHPLRPKTIYASQTVGVVLIFGLMIFAVFGDILFLVRR
ncbi:MAG: site-2 protease family protein [Treponema sp.]|jgi:regulator of sigma E protease|nr:site-2 protease family protein [Treponema sp.]